MNVIPAATFILLFPNISAFLRPSFAATSGSMLPQLGFRMLIRATSDLLLWPSLLMACTREWGDSDHHN